MFPVSENIYFDSKKAQWIDVMDQWVEIWMDIFYSRPALPVQDPGTSYCLHTEGPGYMFDHSMIKSFYIHEGRFYKKYFDKKTVFWVRTYPYYWDRKGCRHMTFTVQTKTGPHTLTFFHLYPGKTPKNR